MAFSFGLYIFSLGFCGFILFYSINLLMLHTYSKLSGPPVSFFFCTFASFFLNLKKFEGLCCFHSCVYAISKYLYLI